MGRYKQVKPGPNAEREKLEVRESEEESLDTLKHSTSYLPEEQEATIGLVSNEDFSAEVARRSRQHCFVKLFLTVCVILITIYAGKSNHFISRRIFLQSEYLFATLWLKMKELSLYVLYIIGILVLNVFPIRIVRVVRNHTTSTTSSAEGKGGGLSNTPQIEQPIVQDETLIPTGGPVSPPEVAETITPTGGPVPPPEILTTITPTGGPVSLPGAEANTNSPTKDFLVKQPVKQSSDDLQGVQDPFKLANIDPKRIEYWREVNGKLATFTKGVLSRNPVKKGTWE